MVLIILDRNEQVLLSQSAAPNAGVSPSLEIAVRQQQGTDRISLTAYTLQGVLLWTGIIQLSGSYTIHTQSAVPVMQVTLFSPAASASTHLTPQNSSAHLQSGTALSLIRDEGFTHMTLLQFTALPFAGLPQVGCVQLLQAWLDAASPVPRHEAFTISSESPLSNLCNQVLNPDCSKVLLYAYLYLKVQEIILALCDLLSSAGLNTMISEQEQKGLHRVAQAIRNEPERNLTVNDLAKIAGLNRSSLQTLFKAHYGTTLRSFALSCRMEAAFRLITSTDLLLKEIAYRLGYSDPDNFYTAFKQYYGKRAGDLRRERDNSDEIN